LTIRPAPRASAPVTWSALPEQGASAVRLDLLLAVLVFMATSVLQLWRTRNWLSMEVILGFCRASRSGSLHTATVPHAHFHWRVSTSQPRVAYARPIRMSERVHSMTLSALIRIDCGIVRPSAFAVFRLT
jgi:hypothetical protein